MQQKKENREGRKAKTNAILTCPCLFLQQAARIKAVFFCVGLIIKIKYRYSCPRVEYLKKSLEHFLLQLEINVFYLTKLSLVTSRFRFSVDRPLIVNVYINKDF